MYSIDERGATINVGGQEHTLVLTTKATKEIGGRYGGLAKMGEVLSKSENFEDALDEVIFLVVLLANQGVLIHNKLNPNDQKDKLTVEDMELFTTPLDLADYKDAILNALLKGTRRTVETAEDEKEKKGPTGRKTSKSTPG